MEWSSHHFYCATLVTTGCRGLTKGIINKCVGDVSIGLILQGLDVSSSGLHRVGGLLQAAPSRAGSGTRVVAAPAQQICNNAFAEHEKEKRSSKHEKVFLPELRAQAANFYWRLWQAKPWHCSLQQPERKNIAQWDCVASHSAELLDWCRQPDVLHQHRLEVACLYCADTKQRIQGLHACTMQTCSITTLQHARPGELTKSIISSNISNVGIGLVLNSLGIADYCRNSSRLDGELAQPPAVAAGGCVDGTSVGA